MIHSLLLWNVFLIKQGVIRESYLYIANFYKQGLEICYFFEGLLIKMMFFLGIINKGKAFG